MKPLDMGRMAEALSLTRAGRLTEAARLLQGGDVAFDIRPAAAPEPGEAGWRQVKEGSRTLRYRLVQPPVPAPSAPILMMLHGCTQGPDDFARGTRMAALASARGIATLWPEQPASANRNRCWNWFRGADQRRGSGEPALLMAAAADARQASGATGPLLLAGLSAGGAMAAMLAALYPDDIAAIAVHSGLPAFAARNLPGAHAAMQQGAPDGPPLTGFVPTFVTHGGADALVSPANADAIARQAARAYGAALYETDSARRLNGVAARIRQSRSADGALLIEQWTLEGAGHAWSGGDPAGSHTSAAGPDMSAEMLRFFAEAVPAVQSSARAAASMSDTR